MKDYVPLIQTALWVALVLAGILILRPELRELRVAVRRRLEDGSAIRVGPVELGELKLQVTNVRTEVSDVRTEVSDLQDRVARLFLLAMSDTMFRNLRKLAGGRFGEFEKSGGLERELRWLREFGYVQVPGQYGIGGIPARGDNLSDFVQVTDTGRQFVELREGFTAE